MKLLKFFLVLTVMSFVFSTICVFAQTQVSWNPLEIKALSEVYTSGIYSKNTSYCTAIYKTSAKDKLTGDDRAINAKISCEAGAGWSDGNTKVNIPTKSWYSWGSGANDCYAMSVKMNLWANSSTLSKANFYGVWNLKYSNAM